jgi:outer membrane protein assembly factor BamA
MLRLLILICFLCLPLITLQASPCNGPTAIIEEVSFTGNDITKERVLLHELSFTPGDTVNTAALDALLEENRKRLFNLRLFHHVDVTYTCQNNLVNVQFDVQERFYLYPIPILDFADRNFNAWLEKQDWDRIDYGFALIRKNFRGRNEDVRVRVQHGFNQRLELSYRVPYLIRKYNLGGEVAVADYRSHVLSYTNSNNRQRFLEQDEELPIKRFSVSTALIHRQSVEKQEGFRVSYQREHVSDSVVMLNPEYYTNSLKERQYMRFELYKVINQRNNFGYPLLGSYFEAGLGQTLFLQNSGSPFTSIRAKYVKYNKLANKLYYMAGAEGQLRLAGEHAFADNYALGFRSYVRGYDLYIVGGQHYGLFKQGITRQLLDIKSIKLKFIDNPKFNNIPLAIYLNAFTDAGYVVDNVFKGTNTLTNRLLTGGGVGVHVVTFYDIVLRFEYALNREGDRGFYFNSKIPF